MDYTTFIISMVAPAFLPLDKLWKTNMSLRHLKSYRLNAAAHFMRYGKFNSFGDIANGVAWWLRCWLSRDAACAHPEKASSSNAVTHASFQLNMWVYEDEAGSRCKAAPKERCWRGHTTSLAWCLATFDSQFSESEIPEGLKNLPRL